MKPTITVTCTGRTPDPFGGWDHCIVARDEDGDIIASHVCSSHSFAQHDMGLSGSRKHDAYDARYPDGWEIQWVDARCDL